MLDEIHWLLSSCILEYNLHSFFLDTPFSEVQWGQTNETNENSWKSVSRCPFALTFSREQPKFHCIVSCNFEQHKNTSCAREQRRIVLAIMNDSLHLHRHEEFISKSSALMLRCPVTVIYAVHRCRLVIWGECSGSEGSEVVWRAGDCVGKVGTCDDISGQPSGSTAQNLNHITVTL